MKRRTFITSVIATTPLAASGCCFFGPPYGGMSLGDESLLTYPLFRRNLSFGSGGQETYAPLPVHQFDVEGAKAAGAKLEIDGAYWLGLDYGARNETLLGIQAKLPWDATLVHQAASGDVWSVPVDSRNLFRSQAIRSWNWGELLPMTGFRDDAAYDGTTLTLDRYRMLTDYSVPVDRDLAPIHFVHDVGSFAWQEIYEANAWTGFVLGQEWNHASPEQRTGQLLNAQNYLNSMPVFQGDALKLNFAISIPHGQAYPIPEAALWRLQASYALKGWTGEDLARIPVTVTPDDQLDRPVTNDFVPQRIRPEF